MLEALGELCRYYGAPKVMFTDPDTAMLSDDFAPFLERYGIIMKNTAGEGHWQHGRIERMIRTLKGVIARTAESYEPGAVSSQELIDSCLNARNQLS